MSQLPLPREMVYLLRFEESPQAEYRGVDDFEDVFQFSLSHEEHLLGDFAEADVDVLVRHDC